MAQVKISDLSVGDWVLNRQGVPTKVQVIVSEGNMRCGEDAKPEHSVHIWVSDVEPIPITPEILEKNGISKTYESDEYAVYKGEGFNVIEYYTELWEFERHRNRLMIRNVHQLQHALRLVGVEKEMCITK